MKHRKTGADITVAALPSNEKNAQAFGLMKIDDSGRIIDFAEKPKGDALRAMRVDTTILGLDAERCATWDFTPAQNTTTGHSYLHCHCEQLDLRRIACLHKGTTT